ncbi:efflux RND transporter periplasmic adaptor subunit [Rhizobium paknamense]|uniref:RND family efflux transporter MFP subunit n=1 Tax=Rhizobium paknamense TaxID=1206817 RepID=A0ABU0IEJ9_9HYPH|nr:efflux RND transporter periplasmic adaptor subunit [Rhizobium paknamense]MDQ0456112.1 RND family efflux transporter MFP subunit [Rhizobium paknamense]
MKKLVFLALAFPLLGLAACQKQEEQKAEPPRPVLSVIARNDATAVLMAPGIVQAQYTTELGFRVLGRVVARNVSVGDIVKKGDVVAALDAIALELAVKSSQADLFNAKAQQTNAATTAQRQKRLAETRSGTESALEEAEQALKTADANVAKAQANLDKAEEQLSYAKLLAEFDGVVTATSVEVGQTVSAGDSVVTIARPDPREVVIDIPEGNIGELKTGSVFDVVLQLDPTVHSQGKVREISPIADTTTRTRRVKITLINPPVSFRLGSVVTASTAMGGETKMTLPASALLIREGEGSFVWVVDEASGKVSRRAVKLEDGRPDGSVIHVTEGIREGERVVTAGVHQLQDGQTVKINERKSQ